MRYYIFTRSPIGVESDGVVCVCVCVCLSVCLPVCVRVRACEAYVSVTVADQRPALMGKTLRLSMAVLMTMCFSMHVICLQLC